MRSAKSLVNQTFGNWKVIDVAPKRYAWGNETRVMLLCECRCDKHTVKAVRADHLLQGTSTSCGCLKSKILSETINRTKPWEYHDRRKQLTYENHGEYITGYTAKGDIFYLDPDDFPLVKDTCWFVHQCGRLFGNYNGRTELITSILLKAHHGYDFEFKNGDKLDYRKDNFIIKEIPHGIYFHKGHQKWHVRIRVDGKRKTVGYYDNIRAAVRALNQAKENLA